MAESTPSTRAEARRVGDPEAGRLDLAPVVARDELLVDDAGRVGDELLAGRRQLPDVAADRLDERADRVGCRLAPRPPELVDREVGLVAV